MLVCADPDAGDAPRLIAARREGDLIGRTFAGVGERRLDVRRQVEAVDLRPLRLAGRCAADEEQRAKARAAFLSSQRALALINRELDSLSAAVHRLCETPGTLPPGFAAESRRTPDRYTVQKGDTLWGISSTFLRDPWLWPEVWYINPQVANPHLIYPGDTLALAFGKDGRPIIRLEQGGAARLDPRLRSSPLDGAIPTIPYSAI